MAAAIGVFALVVPALAAPDLVMEIIGSVCQAIVWFLGQLTLLVVGILINIAQYNEFATESMVGTGWTVVRDVCNMFFIAILLLMAFGTIVPGMGKFTVKGGNLSKLLITAVVINFSRTICAMLIDLSQVIMLTFVSGFKEAAGGNFVNALGLTKMLQENPGSDGALTGMSIVVAYLLAIFMVAIALFTVIAIAVSLLVRIIYLWILVILSPLAFFSRAIPAGFAGGIYSKWWGLFIQYLVGGPLQAFFLWLALVSVQADDFGSTFLSNTTGESVGGATEAFQELELQRFIIAVCLLLVGNMLAKQMAGEATSGGFKFANWAKKKVSGYGKRVGRLAGRGALATGKAGLRGADQITAKIPVLRGQLDADTGRRLTVGQRFQAARNRVLENAPVFGSEAQRKRQLADMQRQAMVLRHGGKLDEAKKLQEKANDIGAGLMVGKHKNDPVGLRDIMSAHSTPTEQEQAKRAMLALAKMGDDSLKGKGKEFLEDEIKKVNGGKEDKVLLGQVIASLKANRDSRAEMEKKDVQDVLDRKPNDQAPFIRGGKVELDGNGQVSDPLYMHYLKNANAEDFKQMKPKLQDKLLSDYAKAVEAFRATGNDEEAKNMAARLSEMTGVRMEGMKPSDFDNMTDEQRKQVQNTLGISAQSAKDAGLKDDAERIMEKQVAMSGRTGLLQGAAAAQAAGDTEGTKRLMDQFMRSFGERMEGMKRGDFLKKDDRERQSTVLDAAAAAKLLEQIGHEKAGEFKSGVMGFTGLDEAALKQAQSQIADWAEVGRQAETERAAQARIMADKNRAEVTFRHQEAVASGKSKETSIDQSVAAAMAGSWKSAEAVREGIIGLQDILDRLSDPKTANIEQARGEIEKISGSLSETVAKAKKPAVLDESGNPISNPYGRSRLARDLESATKGVDAASISRILKEAVRQLYDYTAISSVSGRQESFHKSKDAKDSMESAARNLESVLKEADKGKRTMAAKVSAGHALGSIKLLVDQKITPLSDQSKKMLESMEKDLREIKKAKSIGPEETEKIRRSVESLKGLSGRVHTPVKPK